MRELPTCVSRFCSTKIAPVPFTQHQLSCNGDTRELLQYPALNIYTKKTNERASLFAINAKGRTRGGVRPFILHTFAISLILIVSKKPLTKELASGLINLVCFKAILLSSHLQSGLAKHILENQDTKKRKTRRIYVSRVFFCFLGSS